MKSLIFSFGNPQYHKHGDVFPFYPRGGPGVPTMRRWCVSRGKCWGRRRGSCWRAGWSTSDVLGDAPASRRGRRAGHKCPYMLRRSVWPRRFAKTVFIQLLLVIVEPGAPRNGITRRCLPRSTWGSMPEPAWWRKWIGKLVLFLLLASSPWATIKIYQDQIRLGQPLSTFA